MKVSKIIVGELQTNCYLLENRSECLLIDPGDETSKIKDFIKDKNLNVSYLRIPTEPLRPYLLSPSLYLSYSLTGIIKQFVLNFFGHLNRKELKNSGINYGFFMGVLFSGKMTEKRILKILPHYLKLAEKHHKDIEVTLHPGYTDSSNMMAGCRKGFLKFYLSKWRKTEYDTLLNLKL